MVCLLDRTKGTLSPGVNWLLAHLTEKGYAINRDFQIVDYRNKWVYLNHISSELVPNALNRLLYNFVSYYTG